MQTHVHLPIHASHTCVGGRDMTCQRTLRRLAGGHTYDTRQLHEILLQVQLETCSKGSSGSFLTQQQNNIITVHVQM